MVIEVAYALDQVEHCDVVDINTQHPVLSKMNVFDSESVIPFINAQHFSPILRSTLHLLYPSHGCKKYRGDCAFFQRGDNGKKLKGIALKRNY
jgi:hypothetical protein